jgi:prephenate dehydrogenase
MAKHPISTHALAESLVPHAADAIVPDDADLMAGAHPMVGNTLVGTLYQGATVATDGDDGVARHADAFRIAVYEPIPHEKLRRQRLDAERTAVRDQRLHRSTVAVHDARAVAGDAVAHGRSEGLGDLSGRQHRRLDALGAGLIRAFVTLVAGNMPAREDQALERARLLDARCLIELFRRVLPF